jgi:ABC-type uncharacterized transport system substrate-binding protein
MTNLCGTTFGRAFPILAISRTRTLLLNIDLRKGRLTDSLRLRELASAPVDIIAVFGSPAMRAARQATSIIPNVMIGVGDPVRAGFVGSLARPGGNITGYSSLNPDLIGKRLELLKVCVLTVSRLAFVWNPDNDYRIHTSND